MKLEHKITRITKFEFWPYWFFYFPFVLQWLWYSIKSFDFLYFTKVNYKTRFGGFFQYSKYGLIKDIDSKFLPKTKYYTTLKDLNYDLENDIFKSKFVYKPDIGERGKDVTIFNNLEEFKKEISSFTFPCIVQSFIDLPIELGILFYRFPSGKKGITSIVGKSFLSVTGDGKLTLSQLVDKEIMASKRIDFLSNKFENEWNNIIDKNSTLVLEEVGNHCRGTTFLDYRNIINNQLVETIDLITKDIKGFHYGRLDLKCNSIEELYEGKNIQIIEVNGVNSEANHIYDPKMKLLNAYKSVFQNLEIVNQISRELRQHKVKNPNTLFQFIKAWLIHIEVLN